MKLTPEQIENFTLRQVGKENYKGPKASDYKRRFGLVGFGDKDIFDCDDRAEIARRIAEQNGYQAVTKIQRSRFPGRVAHRYLVISDGKMEYPILKKPEGY